MKFLIFEQLECIFILSHGISSKEDQTNQNICLATCIPTAHYLLIIIIIIFKQQGSPPWKTFQNKPLRRQHLIKSVHSEKCFLFTSRDVCSLKKYTLTLDCSVEVSRGVNYQHNLLEIFTVVHSRLSPPHWPNLDQTFYSV